MHKIPERPATPPPREKALEILKLCTVADIFRTVGYYINPDMVAKINGVIIFNIEGELPWIPRRRITLQQPSIPQFLV